MVSLDVLSLFTKVPINETISVSKQIIIQLILRTAYKDPNNLMEMVLFVEQTIYLQEESLALGLLLSPVIANIYRQCLKVIAIGYHH